MGDDCKEPIKCEVREPTAWYMKVFNRCDVEPFMRYCSEFWASFIFALIVLSVSLTFAEFGKASANPLFQDILGVSAYFIIPLLYGLVLFVVASSFGHLSADVNPAVTITKMLMRRVDIIPGLYTLLISCLGWILAALVLFALTSRAEIAAIRPAISIGTSRGEAFAYEFFGMFILLVVALRHDGRPDGNWSLGLALAIAMYFSLRKSGGAVNPLRILSVSIFGGRFATDDLILYAAECLAVLAAWAILMFCFAPAPKKACPSCESNPCACPSQRNTVLMHSVRPDQRQQYGV